MKRLAALLLVVGCKGGKEQARARDAAPAPAVSVDARLASDAVKAEGLAGAIVDEYLVIVPGDAKPKAPACGAAIAVEAWESPVHGYATKDLNALGVELAKADLEGLVAAKQALHLELHAAQADRARALVEVAACAVAAATAAHGWVFDLSSYQIFAPALLAKLRGGEAPIDARRFTVVRMDPGALGDADTKGMARLGLPELVMRKIPPDVGAGAIFVLYAAAQTLIEQGRLSRDGALDVDLSRLTTPPWPGVTKEVKHNGGSGVITLGARWSHPSDDDAATAIELTMSYRDLAGAIGDVTDTDPGGYVRSMRD